MEDELFLSAQFPTHRRWAIFEDDGVCAVLYVSEPDSTKPAADCIVYNRIPPIPDKDVKKILSRGDAPPISKSYASKMAVLPSPADHNIELVWVDDGSVAQVIIDGELWTSIRVGESRGRSRAIAKAGPFGSPL